jgi:hypothetical protein
LQVRIWRKVEKKDKTEDRLSEALLVSEADFNKKYDEIDNLAAKIRLRKSRLNEDLLSYLRAHCLVMYDGPNF